MMDRQIHRNKTITAEIIVYGIRLNTSACPVVFSTRTGPLFAIAATDIAAALHYIQLNGEHTVATIKIHQGVAVNSFFGISVFSTW